MTDWKSVVSDDRFHATVGDAAVPMAIATTATVDERIAALTKGAPQKEVDDLAEAIERAEYEPYTKGLKIEAMREKLATTVTTIKDTLKAAKKRLDAKAAKEKPAAKSSGKIEFRYHGDFNFHEAVAVCTHALKAKNRSDQRPTFCHISGSTFQLDVRGGRAEFIELEEKDLWGALCTLVVFIRQGEKGDGPAKEVDKDVAKLIYTQARDMLPPAPEVFYTPHFMSDGTLLDAEGWNEASNALLIFGDLRVPAVPASPSVEDMQRALNWIWVEYLSDFPFLDYDDAGNETRDPSAAHAFASLITPFMRRMIHGRTPMFFVVKPVAGTGGTLLMKIPALIFDGALTGYVRYTENEDEMEKKLVAAVKGTSSNLCFDNVDGKFDSAVLENALTAEKVGGRVLQVSKIYERDNLFNWLGSGNNPRPSEALLRRMCLMRLNAKEPDLKSRIFRHGKKEEGWFEKKWAGVPFDEVDLDEDEGATEETLEQFVLRTRGQAICHILTLINYWQTQGKPEFKTRKLPSFEDWSAKVGGVLQVCGVNGFLAGRAPVAVDLGQAATNEFLRKWKRVKGTGAYLSANKLFEWASGEELAIVVGRSEDAKRENFIGRLPDFDGRPFECEGSVYIVDVKNDPDEGMIYGIKFEREAETNVAR